VIFITQLPDKGSFRLPATSFELLFLVLELAVEAT